jgi:hypothetical protein
MSRKQLRLGAYLVGAAIAVFGVALLLIGKYLFGVAFLVAGIAIGGTWGTYFRKTERKTPEGG